MAVIMEVGTEAMVAAVETIVVGAAAASAPLASPELLHRTKDPSNS